MRQHLLQVDCILDPVFRIVQLPVDEVEDVIARNARSQCIPVNLFDLVGDIVHAHVAVYDLTDLPIGRGFAFAYRCAFAKQLTFRSNHGLPGKPGKELGSVCKERKIGQYISCQQCKWSCFAWCHHLKPYVTVLLRREHRWQLILSIDQFLREVTALLEKWTVQRGIHTVRINRDLCSTGEFLLEVHIP